MQRVTKMTSAKATAALIAAAMAAGCHLVTPFEPSASHDADGDADAEVDGQADVLEDADAADADEEVEPDGDVRSGSGALVHVMSVLDISTERVCDVDEDGTLDNSIADLGSPGDDLFAIALGTVLDEALSADERPVLHFRWIDDLAGPDAESTTLAAYTGRDTDFPRDPSDDTSGIEPLYADASDLDPCGEPLYRTADVRIDGGEVFAGSGAMTMAVEGGSIGVKIAELSGTMPPGGATFRGRICGYLPVHEMDTDLDFSLAPGLSMLEVVLAGGRVLSLPAVPGLTPDVDVDGDGLEIFILDSEGHIAQCIDGDRTILEGRDCWSDPRMADGFSMTFLFETVTARYAGPGPGWEYQVPAGCPSWPLAESFFDTVPPSDGTCAGQDDRCDPRAPTPCCDPEHVCSGANTRTYRCYAPCESPRCLFGPYLASCHESTVHTESLCWPVDDDYPDWDECIPGSDPCTTVHGASTDTVCIDVPSHGPLCLQRCSGPTDGCGGSRRCVPLPFEGGGVCAYESGTDPDRDPG